MNIPILSCRHVSLSSGERMLRKHRPGVPRHDRYMGILKTLVHHRRRRWEPFIGWLAPDSRQQILPNQPPRSSCLNECRNKENNDEQKRWKYLQDTKIEVRERANVLRKTRWQRRNWHGSLFLGWRPWKLSIEHERSPPAKL
jgi:hypothetical protein